MVSCALEQLINNEIMKKENNNSSLYPAVLVSLSAWRII
jgi:hypothetical protein